MIEALIAWAWPYVLAAGVVLAGLWQTYSSGKKAGRNEKAVEQAKERARDMERLRNAADARPSSSLQNDEYNRDNR